MDTLTVQEDLFQQHPYLRVSMKSEDWKIQIAKIFREYGTVVISDVWSQEECNDTCADLYAGLSKLSPPLDKSDVGTFNRDNVPAGPRLGMMQTLVGNMPCLWKVRTDTRVRDIFETLYSDLRGKSVKDFYCSIDGMTVRPPVKSFHTTDGYPSDWAHLDQTFLRKPEDIFNCIQGQCVFSKSTACFRASTKSHNAFPAVLEALGIDGKKDNSNWAKFSNSRDNYEKIKDLVEGPDVQGSFQIPIYAPAGSMILWTSSTIHSAKTQNPPVPDDTKDTVLERGPFDDWRFVAYVCYRPQADCKDGHGNRLQRCIQENRMTNHWGTRMFPKSVFPDHAHRNNVLDEFMKNPALVYESIPELKPVIGPEIGRLIEPIPSTGGSLKRPNAAQASASRPPKKVKKSE